MSYAQTQETIATITHGRKALADNANLREAWAGLLEAITAIPLPDRVAFHRYVRLVHGTTAGLTIPHVISEEEVDEVREALARLRRQGPIVLPPDDVDLDDDSLGRAMHESHDLSRFELAQDRPDRG